MDLSATATPSLVSLSGLVQPAPAPVLGPPSLKKLKPPKPVPPGAIVTDKSCSHCRVRKVKCNRVYPTSTDPARVAELEKRLAELEAVIASSKGGITSVVATPDFRTTSDSPESDRLVANIGAGSIDWRLATPQLAEQLSIHLCDAFSSSCCFLLPTYRWYQGNMSVIKSGVASSPANQVALAVFRAVGARTSPHSGLLGITINPEDQVTHPAYATSFENNVAEEPSVEALAALLSLMQMSIFVELYPKKSKSSLRTAISHYKELLDNATSDAERLEIRRMFGFALYTADSLISASSKRAPMLTAEDIKTYFRHIGLVIPKLPDDQLREVLEKMLTEARRAQKRDLLKTIRHLVHCWVCVAQRAFGQLAAPPAKAEGPLAESIRILWTGIDQIRVYIQSILSFVSEIDPNAFSARAKHTHQHSHETDWVPQFVRLDRDLLDLQNMIHAVINSSMGLQIDLLRPESDSRVRKGLKSYALYSKLYTTGADSHMIFHQFFQLELLPDWTTLALQRVGSDPGPKSVEEELTTTELEWLIEGLQLDCFYTPDAQNRLNELSPRFVQIEQAQQDFMPPLPSPSAAVVPPSDLSDFDSLFTSFTTTFDGPMPDFAFASDMIATSDDHSSWQGTEAVAPSSHDWFAFL
ncbi:hypothetical protein OIV83_005230 [Microbotryomycetes sp. JL201]|nr:hypothetical protein OIV83_005230 [Microbotryomycetes sp. JL201]